MRSGREKWNEEENCQLQRRCDVEFAILRTAGCWVARVSSMGLLVNIGNSWASGGEAGRGR